MTCRGAISQPIPIGRGRRLDHHRIGCESLGLSLQLVFKEKLIRFFLKLADDQPRTTPLSF